MIAQCVKKETGKKYLKKLFMSELLSVDWLFAITLLLIWVGLMLAQGTKGKEIRKPIQYCNSLELKKEGISLWEIFAEMKLAYKSCWNSYKYWNYNEIQLTVSFRCKRMRLVDLCGDWSASVETGCSFCHVMWMSCSTDREKITDILLLFQRLLFLPIRFFFSQKR